MLTLGVVTLPATLASLESEWSELLNQSACNEPTLSPTWLMTWWRVFGDDAHRSLRICVIRDDRRLVALAPLLARPHWHRGFIPYRRLELLASGENEADEILSDYIGIVVARGYETAATSLLADALLAGQLGPWDEIVLPRMRSGRTVWELCRALEERGANVTVRAMDRCAFVALPRTWDDYLAALPPRHRYKVRRAYRDFQNWAGKSSRIEIASTREELAYGMQVLRALHTERWTSDGRPGVFGSARFSQFHDLVAPKLLDRGALQLAWCTVRNEPIAAAYNIVWNGTVYFYQSGRKTALPRHVCPGIALHTFLIQLAIERGLGEYDFLGGDAQYKTQLATDTRELVTLRVTPPRALREGVLRVTEKGVDGLRIVRTKIQAFRFLQPGIPISTRCPTSPVFETAAVSKAPVRPASVAPDAVSSTRLAPASERFGGPPLTAAPVSRRLVGSATVPASQRFPEAPASFAPRSQRFHGLPSSFAPKSLRLPSSAGAARPSPPGSVTPPSPPSSAHPPSSESPPTRRTPS